MDPRLLSALDFAAEKHKLQKRKDKEQTPYINHPIRVAYLLGNAGVLTFDVLIVAVLHDVVEDTGTTLEEIETRFSPWIAEMVGWVTDDKKLNKAERKRQQIVKAAKAPHGAKLVKLADKLANLVDQRSNPPANWSAARILGYHVWCYKVIDALRGTNSVLEQALDDLWRKPFKLNGDWFPGLHTLGQEEKDQILSDYYLMMERCEEP